MPKSKTVGFFCKECGYESSKWAGQCPACKEWNSFVEQLIDTKQKKNANDYTLSSPQKLDSIKENDLKRIPTLMSEMDRVLGGGIVLGSLILIGGDPGIGKSTLLLQLCRNLSNEFSILYISGEESLGQVKMRANRMGEFGSKLSILCETNLDAISNTIKTNKPSLVVIDSIQTMYREDVSSAPGSVSQVRESTNLLMQIAKGQGIPIFVVGHVTKEGVVAGPRMLEHMVDTVLYLEGDRYASYRILRGVKNRFGSTNEIGVFEMNENGLKEVLNPSEYMLEGRPKDASGSCVTCSMEGTRPLLVEIQALVTRSNFGMPRRTAVGCDVNRVNLLMAVLEKRLGFRLGEYDAYINIVGGIKLREPAIDLGLVISILSSYKDIYISPTTICFGEVGLNGELRAISGAAQRINESIKLGFKKCLLPKGNLKEIDNIDDIELVFVENVKEVIDRI